MVTTNCLELTGQGNCTVPLTGNTPEDLLRDMPMGTGLYSATRPNMAGLNVANAAFAKNSKGRPVEFQIAVARAGVIPTEPARYRVSSVAAPYRHRLEDISVRVEVMLKSDETDLIEKFKKDSVVSLTGVVGNAEFLAVGGKVQLVLVVHNPVVR